jgi:putative tryptophan/tyrosine transport system substrate-binding protein
MTTIGRRKFIAALGTAAAWPLVARAQQPAMRRIGVLMGSAETDALSQSFAAAFVQGLKQLGWIEGQNVRIDIRWDSGTPALAKTYAAQLIGLPADVILSDTTPNLVALREATSSVPIVFIRVADPVEQGFVASLTNPGGNLTGFSAYDFSTGGKWLDLLKEASPQLARAGILFNPDVSPQSKFFIRAMEAAAPALGVQVVAIPVHAATEIEPALESLAQQPNGGLVVPADQFLRLHEKLVADLALRLRLPSICFDSDFPKIGGLLSYSADTNYVEQYQQAASYVDRILKGTKAGDLPIQRPDKYKVIINFKTAKTLGLTIPLSLAGLADEVIE